MTPRQTRSIRHPAVRVDPLQVAASTLLGAAVQALNDIQTTRRHAVVGDVRAIEGTLQSTVYALEHAIEQARRLGLRCKWDR